MHDLDQIGRDAEFVGDDLRQRCAQALAVRRRADASLDKAGRIDGEDDSLPAGRDLHAARGKRRTAVTGALGEGRKADAEMAALSTRCFLPGAEGGNVDRLHRHFQRLFVGGLVINEADRRRVGKLADQVAAADVDRINAERRRCFIHQPLQCERDDWARHAAIGRHGAGIRQHPARAAFVIAEIVGPGHFRHGHQRLDAAGGRKTRISADVGNNVGLERDQFCIFVEGAFERDVLIAGVKAGDQILAPVLGPGHRTFKFTCQPHQHDVFGAERHFLAEAAADIGRDHA